ncbi:unnamed protein product [Brugia timori]|uniref:Ovule protein n=1 Tax=Brugia timori TaxID=42155 RepID=A0A0R3R4Z3_9BILA|nr:unnamed protein product [Brugia timori]
MFFPQQLYLPVELSHNVNYYTKTSKSLTLSRECAKTISKEEPIQGSVCWFSNFICFEILFVRI